MTAQYILPEDYAAYGLPDTTTPAQVAYSSLIVDGELNRPAGCLYETDDLGTPVYMTRLKTTMSITLLNDILPGNDIIVYATGPLRSLIGANAFGQTAVLDKTDSSLREVCVIKSVNAQEGTVTLSRVMYPHAAGTFAEFGLTIQEEKFLPRNIGAATMSYTPVARIVGAQSQVTYPRQGDMLKINSWDASPFNYFGVFGVNAGVPIFNTLNVDDIETTDGSGLLYFPGSLFTGYYNNIRVNYIAGWTYKSLPDAIKQATAQIVITNNSPSININISGPVSKYRAGDTEINYAISKSAVASSFLNANSISSLLAPYVRSNI